MDSTLIRQRFLDFFAARGHHIVPSAPVVNKDDPTLLFTNAGMNQFKDIFTGNKPVTYSRIADTQKCLRVSGKHNDLEEVGYDTYHHTLFEMLGNWSFGDYFKAEAILWAWEFITKEMGIDPARVYVTVFEGAEGLERDTEAASEWEKWIAPERVLYFGKKDNFWEMGDTGPCGPCTEIHVDLRPDAERAKIPGHELVNQSDPQVVEIWNLVFIQYNRKADGNLEALAMKSVDTGMGFERLAMVLQGRQSTYDTDVFTGLRAALEQESGMRYGESEMSSVAMRVAMDHIRAIALAISDGQLPSNTGAGYVIRRLIRRASRYGFQYLGLTQPYLYRLVTVLVNYFGQVFPELQAQQGFVAQVIEQEEKSFLEKLERGSRLFEEHLHAQPAGLQGSKMITGKFAFELYDTFGFPLDLTELIARERNYTVDVAGPDGFNYHMEQQRARSKGAAQQQTGDWVVIGPQTDPIFVGYDKLSLTTELLKYRTVATPKGNAYQLVLAQTPFYAESGGQVGDTGVLLVSDEEILVLNTVKENDLIIHVVDRLPARPELEIQATVDSRRRGQISRSHSATHLLHAALRQVLGTHVEQRGSLVADGHLRFDFSHFQKVTDDELLRIEGIVNEKIAEAIPLLERRSVPIAEAKSFGAMALFGEKYGERVRVIEFQKGFSTELCGGTHVQNTLEIRLCKLTAESSISAGIRRIEAVTDWAAIAWFEAQTLTLNRLIEQLGKPQQPEKAVQELLEANQQLALKVKQGRQHILKEIQQELEAKFQSKDGLHVLIAKVEVENADELRTLTYALRQGKNLSAIVLGAVAEGKPLLSVMFTDDVTGRDATALVRELAKEIQGGGGGQKNYATAGGKKPEGLDAALAKAEALLEKS